MQLEKYLVRTSENRTGYMFVSVGEQGHIIKVVDYALTASPNEYNLGFGDYDPLTGNISDTIRSNNGDRDKVLATVASTAIDFLKWHPEATIFAKGSTAARTRMYQMGINRFYEEISDTHEVFGLRGNEWEKFEQNALYEAFRMRIK